MPDVHARVTEFDASIQRRLVEVVETRGADPQQRAMRRAVLADLPCTGISAEGSCGRSVLAWVLTRQSEPRQQSTLRTRGNSMASDGVVRSLDAVAVRAAGEAFFRGSPRASFETEELVALSDRAVERRVYRRVDREGKSGRVRGVDVLEAHDGKVAETLSYVKC